MSPKGWHSRGYLPHFDSPETLQFVTFRLVDSLPADAIENSGLQPDQSPLPNATPFWMQDRAHAGSDGERLQRS